MDISIMVLLRAANYHTIFAQGQYYVHCQFPFVVTVLWQSSEDVVTILSLISGTSRWLQNHEPVSPWLWYSDDVLLGA